MSLLALAAACAGSLWAATAKPLPALTDLGKALDEDGRVALYVDFDFAKSALKPEGEEELAQVARALRERPRLRLSVEAHSDALATPEENQALTDARAKAVVDALEKLGVERGRLTARGYGSSRPLRPKGVPSPLPVRDERVELADPGFAGQRRALALEARDAERGRTLVFRRVPDYFVSGEQNLASADNARLAALAGGPVRGEETVVSYRHPDADQPGAKLPTPAQLLEEYESGMRASGGFLVEKSTAEVVLSLMQEKARTWVLVQAPSGKAYVVTTLVEPLR